MLTDREHPVCVGLDVEQCVGRVYVGGSSLWEVDINNLSMAVKTIQFVQEGGCGICCTAGSPCTPERD